VLYYVTTADVTMQMLLSFLTFKETKENSDKAGDSNISCCSFAIVG
jgi:hypothetical protein